MYVPLDVNFPDNDKVVRCSLAATGLYVVALCLCKRLQLDGELSRRVLRRYADGDDFDELVSELVFVGLFDATDDAIHIPAWLGHNQASDEYMTSDKGSRMAHTRWHVGRNVVKPGCSWCDEAKEQVDASACPPDAQAHAGAHADPGGGHMQEVEVEQEIEKPLSSQSDLQLVPPSSNECDWETVWRLIAEHRRSQRTDRVSDGWVVKVAEGIPSEKLPGAPFTTYAERGQWLWETYVVNERMIAEVLTDRNSPRNLNKREAA